ncbi:ATP-binding protein [Aureibaculum sp. 2210JD6-5]|uniref:sensor histidine kinase n=1 Tax=Aureibaculum sp. 2210JD6-5 TaxID=3103957 RepID=UPI002AACDCF6|nr:ATP-binding protein [Aureibaculum sp. 2210JD6-5]MDY7393872.1 ATP-binding protein [Aureibaculum sp. 2210JD6-5]
MASRNFYLQLILRISLITLTALGIAFLFVKGYYVLSVFIFALLILQAWQLVYYINNINRKIAYFFDAIRNEDFTLHFPEKDLIKSFQKLNHSLNRVNALIQDVHLKKQEQEQFYQEIIKQADIGILAFNRKGHINFSNPTVERLLNYKPLNHIKQLAQVDKKLYALFEDLKPFDQKLFQLANEREKIQLAIKSTSIDINQEELLVVVIQDIHKELDEKETDSWIKLIRVLTHEIMNTITPITSISESILKYFKNDNELTNTDTIEVKHIENTVKGLEVIKEQGNDLMSFVQSYRTLLSVPEPDKEIVGAQKLLSKILVLIQQDGATDNVEIRLEINPENLELFIDSKQITQVLINLGKNAMQSLKNKESGIIKISAGVNKANKKHITISDNGAGIAPELIEEIFVPFFTTKNSGTGIGLSLSKQIMQLHGGSLMVHSIPDERTTFVLTF